jgi:hypothetical protein
MTQLPDIDPSQIVYKEKPVWFLTQCDSSDCKEMWYFSHEIDSIIHHEDGTHTLGYQGIVFEQSNLNPVLKPV